jgi:hypothetical protein
MSDPHIENIMKDLSMQLMKTYTNWHRERNSTIFQAYELSTKKKRETPLF